MAPERRGFRRLAPAQRAALLGLVDCAAEGVRRLVGTLLAAQTDAWQATRCYLSQESLARVINPDSAQALLEEQPAV